MDISSTVACPYCRAERHQPCRDTMRDGRPVLDMPHPSRIDYAEEVEF